MSEEITSLDLRFLVKELKEALEGGKIQGIKQENKTFLFEIYKKERFFLKVLLDKTIYLTKKKEKFEKATSFCMQLRKYLLGKTIGNVFQVGFDRIVELEINGLRLIFEIFRNGNLILVNSSGLIITAFEKREWKDRKILPKALYRYPPSCINPFDKSFFDFQKTLKEKKNEIVKVLALDFGLSRKYAEEICERLGIKKEKICSELDQNEIDKLFRFFEELKNVEIKPHVILENKKIVEFFPFETEKFKEKEKIYLESFNQAVESYFESLLEFGKIEEKIKELKKSEEKIEKIYEKQMAQLEKLEKNYEKYRKIGKILYEKYQALDFFLKKIVEMREKKLSWEEIKAKVKALDKEKILKEINQAKASLTFLIDGNEIEVDFRKSLEENANFYFSKAKKVKEKIEKLKKAAEKIKSEEKVKGKEEKKEWYERFRWFISSDNFLIIAGKDAKTNEEIVKKYSREKDLILHADIRGAPFVLIRNEKKKEIPMETIMEAAEFAASYSKAWLLGLGTIDVFYVKPEQVVKEALPLGSFKIKGKREWLKKVLLRVSIGLKIEDGIKIIAGPVTAIKKQTPYIVTICPGDVSSEELAREIKRELLLKVPFEIKNLVEKIELEEIKRHIPYGKGKLVL
ncbi:MAG: ribosome rescue protein RqcH [Candidatus Aenigmatarchaeota archaeon]